MYSLHALPKTKRNYYPKPNNEIIETDNNLKVNYLSLLAIEKIQISVTLSHFAKMFPGNCAFPCDFVLWKQEEHGYKLKVLTREEVIKISIDPQEIDFIVFK